MAWALVAVGCRDPNPYFVEPPLASGTDDASGSFGSTTAPTTGGLPATMTDSTGTSSGVSTTGTDTSITGLIETTTTGTTGMTDTTGTTGLLCEAGVIVCEGETAKVCDGSGGFESTELCSSVCAPGLGCVLCMPDAKQCAGPVVQSCVADGSAWQDVQTCDVLQGLGCDANEAACTGACAPGQLGLREVGCDFYGTSLANLHIPEPWNANYGVIVVSTGLAVATVTVTRAGETMSKVMIPPSGSVSIALTYIAQVSQSGAKDGQTSLIAVEGAYRLRSTQPVVIYQYEPLQPTGTGDASLLQPVHTWGADYLVASREYWVGNVAETLGGFYAVLASEDDTQVTVTPSGFGGTVGAGAGVGEDGNGVVTLDAGDVLEVFAISGDITGTRVTADRPVAVFGGHRCSQVPLGLPSCDHLEESMLPVDALGKEYVVVPPLGPDDTLRPQMIRILATEADTMLTYTPQQDALAQLDAGQWTEIGPTTNSFTIVADKKVAVAQYMTGGLAETDPAMTITTPTGQYRDNYLLAASPLYTSRLLTIVAPFGAKLTMDGAPIEGWSGIPGTDFVTRALSLPANALGTNLIAGDQAFGVSVYGHAFTTSYWYPGGLELQMLP